MFLHILAIRRIRGARRSVRGNDERTTLFHALFAIGLFALEDLRLYDSKAYALSTVM